jgi:hypothetical protein
MTTNANSDDLWGPIKFDNWEETNFIKGKTATEEDVKSGNAVFYIEKEEHVDQQPLDIQIPSLAYQLDEETGEKKLVVIIQAEKAGDQELVGIRYFEGGNGVCMSHELEFIE